MSLMFIFSTFLYFWTLSEQKKIFAFFKSGEISTSVNVINPKDDRSIFFNRNNNYSHNNQNRNNWDKDFTFVISGGLCALIGIIFKVIKNK